MSAKKTAPRPCQFDPTAVKVGEQIVDQLRHRMGTEVIFQPEESLPNLLLRFLRCFLEEYIDALEDATLLKPARQERQTEADYRKELRRYNANLKRLRELEAFQKGLTEKNLAALRKVLEQIAAGK